MNTKHSKISTSKVGTKCSKPGILCISPHGGTSSIDAVGVVAPVVRVCGDWLLEKRDSSLYVRSLTLVSELMIEGVEMERSRDTFLNIIVIG